MSPIADKTAVPLKQVPGKRDVRRISHGPAWIDSAVDQRRASRNPLILLSPMNGSARTSSAATSNVACVASRVNAPLAIVLGALVLVAVLFWPTSIEIADLWQDTVRRRYTHGWLVLAITVWLIWRDRAQLRCDRIGAADLRLVRGSHRQRRMARRLQCRIAGDDDAGHAAARARHDLGGGRESRRAAGRLRRALSLFRVSGVGADQPVAAVADGPRQCLADSYGGHSGDDGGKRHPDPRRFVRDRGRLQRPALLHRRAGHRRAAGRTRSGRLALAMGCCSVSQPRWRWSPTGFGYSSSSLPAT